MMLYPLDPSKHGWGQTGPCIVHVISGLDRAQKKKKDDYSYYYYYYYYLQLLVIVYRMICQRSILESKMSS